MQLITVRINNTDYCVVFHYEISYNTAKQIENNLYKL